MPPPRAAAPAERSVRFALDGRIVEVDDADPTRTVLEYLREDLQRTGTKEGCAEGDCGACTVVLGELDGGRVRFRAINACIRLLPTLDGKALFTVESLKGADGGLHPVQRALVECHGSQCGFCTPGFVMSLFALYKSARDPSRAAIEDALAGNLCRCTGYRPIVDAAQRMYAEAAGDAADRHWMNCSFSSPTDAGPSTGERAIVEQLESIRRDGTLTLERAGRRYFAPSSLAELLHLRTLHPDARIVAGGTDVGLWITKQLREIPTVIHVGNVAELARIDAGPDALVIGAAVPLTDAFAALVREHPDLDELARRFASPPIRNSGTLGGNVANGSPIGDSMPALIALGATVRLAGEHGRRELALEDFYLAYQKTALAADEVLEAIVVPRASPGTRFRAYKVSKRFDQDISTVCGAYRLRIDGGVLREVRIAYGGVAGTPRRATLCEAALAGQPWNDATLAAGIAALARDFTPLSDQRGSARYRALVTGNLLKRLYLETGGAAGDATRVERSPEVSR